MSVTLEQSPGNQNRAYYADTDTEESHTSIRDEYHQRSSTPQACHGRSAGARGDFAATSAFMTPQVRSNTQLIAKLLREDKTKELYQLLNPRPAHEQTSILSNKTLIKRLSDGLTLGIAERLRVMIAPLLSCLLPCCVQTAEERLSEFVKTMFEKERRGSPNSYNSPIAAALRASKPPLKEDLRTRATTPLSQATMHLKRQEAIDDKIDLRNIKSKDPIFKVIRESFSETITIAEMDGSREITLSAHMSKDKFKEAVTGFYLGRFPTELALDSLSKKESLVLSPSMQININGRQICILESPFLASCYNQAANHNKQHRLTISNVTYALERQKRIDVTDNGRFPLTADRGRKTRIARILQAANRDLAKKTRQRQRDLKQQSAATSIRAVPTPAEHLPSIIA